MLPAAKEVCTCEDSHPCYRRGSELYTVGTFLGSHMCEMDEILSSEQWTPTGTAWQVQGM